MRATVFIRCILLGAALASSGCGSQDEEEPSAGTARGGARTGTTAPPPVYGVATFTADQSARIAIVLHDSGLARARLAAQRASLVEVRVYAERMAAAHEAVLEKLEALAARAQPWSDDATPRLLARDGDLMLAELGSMPPATFDVAYMTFEASFHAQELGLLDGALLPSAARGEGGSEALSRELASELSSIRAQAADYLVHALRVQGLLRAGQTPTFGGGVILLRPVPLTQ